MSLLIAGLALFFCLISGLYLYRLYVQKTSQTFPVTPCIATIRIVSTAPDGREWLLKGWHTIDMHEKLMRVDYTATSGDETYTINKMAKGDVIRVNRKQVMFVPTSIVTADDDNAGDRFNYLFKAMQVGRVNYMKMEKIGATFFFWSVDNDRLYGSCYSPA